MQEEKESIYIENSVLSYYTSRPEVNNIIVYAHQEITRKWWPMAIKRYNVFVSDIVIEEASRGDPIAAKKRLEVIKNFTILVKTKDVDNLSQIYKERLSIPPKSIGDADHLAVACLNDVDYLVTWNCVHICNAEVIKKLMKINKELDVNTPIICTPENLMEVNHERPNCL